MLDIAGTFVDEVRERVGPTAHVIGAVSGGVDSSVAAVLLNKAIGDRFHAVMVDNGCLRMPVRSFLGARFSRTQTNTMLEFPRKRCSSKMKKVESKSQSLA